MAAIEDYPEVSTGIKHGRPSDNGEAHYCTTPLLKLAALIPNAETGYHICIFI